jgi:hypothetical protein
VLPHLNHSPAVTGGAGAKGPTSGGGDDHVRAGVRCAEEEASRRLRPGIKDAAGGATDATYAKMRTQLARLHARQPGSLLCDK